MSVTSAPSTGRSFRKKTLAGISWTMAAQFARQAIQLVYGIVLARLLSPDVYGLIGMITVFTGFLFVFKDLGLGAALVQKQDASESHLSTVFWINVALGVILTMLTAAAAPLIARFYGEPTLVPLILVTSIGFFIGSFGIVHRTLVQKGMDFKKLALVDIASLTIGGVAAIVMAASGFGVWSLVAQTLLTTTMSVAGLWLVGAWFPRFLFSWAALRELWGFSSNLMAFTSLNYWLRNADNLLIGRVLGTEALGLYSRAYALMLLPLKNVSTAVSHVMFPAFSSIQNDKPRIAGLYLRMTRSIALVTFPLMLGLAASAEHFVYALFGSQWAAMIPVVRLLSIVGMLQSIGSLNGNLFLSQGRTDLQLRVGGSIGVAGIFAIVVGLRWGINGVALAYTLFTLIVLYPSIQIAVNLVGLTFRTVARSLVGVLAAASVMAGLVWVVGVSLPSSWPHSVQLALQVLGGIAVYWLLMSIFRVKAYGEVRELLSERLPGWPLIGRSARVAP